ncbi:MAG: type I-E CRISPR-associated protein Cse1/CasA [Smithella sp.]|nr:type I-E CRISPR-associated protein Cse1/CasA [Smithella sp.]
MAEFNLIDEEWIPCITLDGRNKEFGIQDTLLKAHELREICDDSPLVTVAIHRLLLAILYRAFQGPTSMRQWKEFFASGSFYGNKSLTDYLAKDKWYDRFFLFDDDYPFMQIAKLDLNEYKDDGKIKKDNSDGLMRLLREAPDKKGRILFDHRVGTERPEYEPKQIARMILAAQSYAGTGVASGGKIGDQVISPSPCQFATCVKGLCLWLQGENLFQTLMFNLVHIPIDPNDLPPWEDSNIIKSAERSWKNPIPFTGPIQRFTPLSRFIRVLDRRSMFFTNGMKTNADADDPMKAYTRTTDTDQFAPIELNKDKAAWRDAHALFSLTSTTRKPPACLNHVARLFQDGTLPKSAQPLANIVGLAASQGKSFLWRHERLPVPIALLSDVNLVERLGKDPDGLLPIAEQVANVLHSRTTGIARFIRIPNGREPSKNEWGDINSIVQDINPHPAYWARLEEHFFDLLENLPGDWDETTGYWKPPDQQIATQTWRDAIKHEAKRALEESVRTLGTTARAISAVARVEMDFSDSNLMLQPPKAKTVKQKSKSTRKGGKKI